MLLDQPLNWNIAFTAMQVGEYLKNYLGGLIKWRDDEAILAGREYKRLNIKCFGERQYARTFRW